MSTIFRWKLLILILKTHHDVRIIIVPLSINLMWQIFLLDLIICLFCIILLYHLLTSLYLWCTRLFVLFNTLNCLSRCNNCLLRISRTDVIIIMSFLWSYPIHIAIGLSAHTSLIILDRSVEWNLNPSIIVSYNG